MIDLERALTDLADHLDHPAGDRMAEAVRTRLATPIPLAARRSSRSRSLVAVAAVFVLIVAAALTIPPSRHAIADWLGIGVIEVRRSEAPAGTGTRPVPGATPDTASAAAAARELTAARKVVEFEVAVPRGAAVGALSGVEVDRRVPGGLVVLSYPRFTVVEAAANPVDPEPIAKFVDPGARVDHVSVGGSPGLWISDAHSIAFINRAGELQTDSLRRSGPVLIWERGGVTYRIEGLATLADAQAVAASIG